MRGDVLPRYTLRGRIVTNLLIFMKEFGFEQVEYRKKKRMFEREQIHGL
jgi:hypothetical protein